MSHAFDLYTDLQGEPSQGEMFHSPRGGALVASASLLEQGERISAISGEKLQLQISLVEAQTAIEPLRLENAQLYRERDFLKTRAEQTLTELEDCKRESLRLLEQKLALDRKVQQVTDEHVQLALSSTQSLSDAQTQVGAWRAKCLEAQVDLRAATDVFELEKHSMEEKLRLKDALVAIFEDQKQTAADLLVDAEQLRQANQQLTLGLAQAQTHMAGLQSQVDELKNHNEILLVQRLDVGPEDDVGAGAGGTGSAVLQQLMRRPHWKVSDLVSELTRTREAADAAVRGRVAAESTLAMVQEEVEARMRVFDEQQWRFASLQAERADLKRKNDDANVQLGQAQRGLAEARAHSRLLEGAKLSLTAVLNEKLKVLAATVHELELLRTKLPGAAGRMLPPLLPVSEPSAAATEPPATAASVRQLVEENAALRVELLAIADRSDRELELKTGHLFDELAAKTKQVEGCERELAELHLQIAALQKLVQDGAGGAAGAGAGAPGAGAGAGAGASGVAPRSLVSELEAEILRLRLSLSKQQQQLAKVQEQSTRESHKTADLEAELRTSRREATRACEETKTFEKRALRLQHDSDELQTANAKLLAQNSSLARTAADLQSGLAGEKAATEALKKAVGDANAVRAHQLETIKTLTERSDVLKKTYDENLAQLKQLFDDERTRHAHYVELAQAAIKATAAGGGAAAALAGGAASGVVAASPSWTGAGAAAFASAAGDASSPRAAPAVPAPTDSCESSARRWRELAEAAEVVGESQRVRMRALERALEDAAQGPEHLRGQVEELQETVKTQSGQLADLQQQLVVAKTELAAMASRMKTSVEGEQMWRREGEEAVRKTKELEVLVAKLADQRTCVQDDLERAKEQVKILNAENSKLLSMLGSGSATGVGALVTSRSAWQVREEGLQLELQLVRAKTEAAGAENGQLRTRLSAQSDRLALLEQQLGALDMAKRRLAELQLVEAENRQLFADLVSVRQRLEESEAELAKQVTSNSAPAPSEETSAEMARLQSQVDKLKIEKEQLEKARAQLAVTVKTLREQGQVQAQQLAAAQAAGGERQTHDVKLLGLLRAYQEVLAEVTGSSTSKKRKL